MHLLFPPIINCINASNSSYLPVSNILQFPLERSRIDFSYSSVLGWVCWLALAIEKAEVSVHSFQTRPQEASSSSVDIIMRKTNLSQPNSPRRKWETGGQSHFSWAAYQAWPRAELLANPQTHERAQPRSATPHWDESSPTMSPDHQSVHKCVSSTNKWLVVPLSFRVIN